MTACPCVFVMCERPSKTLLNFGNNWTLPISAWTLRKQLLRLPLACPHFTFSSCSGFVSIALLPGRGWVLCDRYGLTGSMAWHPGRSPLHSAARGVCFNNQQTYLQRRLWEHSANEEAAFRSATISKTSFGYFETGPCSVNVGFANLLSCL